MMALQESYILRNTIDEEMEKGKKGSVTRAGLKRNIPGRKHCVLRADPTGRVCSIPAIPKIQNFK